ncbi:thermonuclease family protein [Gloeothece verrucosa]|uniref:Nuclease (SNase domain protein) n=1 Tax=Gloeothece verrucosa (strain PCC 7822) TaxID=497965 RepID=E0UMS9_GLOV7|nr:thermonuclease family protein [Gloeothece verrucosa]ADN18259.1 nuclease (SNase domain protein) [Gloeothece verrucosa PCC 7822]
MNKWVTSILLVVLSTNVATVAQNLPTATMVSVGDGDTLRVNQQGQTITIRLGCVDSPEMSQNPYGQQAANRLKQLLPKGKTVNVRRIDRDRYNRTVAEIYLNNKSINLTLVSEGMAVVYPQYLNGCAATKNQLLAAQSAAKQKRLGFWKQNNPIMPWDYRAGKRPVTNTPSTANNNKKCDPSYPDICIPPPPPALDCGQISQRRFRVLAPDPHGFDGDKDGIGCER